MEKIIKMLHADKCIKLICGAGNENQKEIEKLAFVFSKAGFNMIDVCAKKEIISAARNGILRAKSNMAVCVSVGLKDDIHMTKAIINRTKCNFCQKCINICPQNALYIEDKKINTDDKKCIGCGKCNKECSQGAIVSEHKYKTPYEMLLPIISENIDCVEFHCTSENTELILDSFNKIKGIYNGVISICLDRSKLSDENIIILLKEIIKEKDNIIIQADGNPMSGGNNTYNSTLETVAFAKLIRDARIENFLILSGGTNAKTTELAKLCDINIDGVALGSYARKIVKEYISDDNFFENNTKQEIAIEKAKALKESLLIF